MPYYFECPNCDADQVEVWLEDEPDLELSCMGCGAKGCSECIIRGICFDCDVDGVDNEDEDEL